MQRQGGRCVDPPAARPVAGGVIEASAGLGILAAVRGHWAPDRRCDGRALFRTTVERPGTAGRRKHGCSRTTDGNFEARSDTAAAGRLARQRASGDVPPRFAPWLGLVLPSHLPGDLPGEAMRPAAPFERYFGGGGGVLGSM